MYVYAWTFYAVQTLVLLSGKNDVDVGMTVDRTLIRRGRVKSERLEIVWGWIDAEGT